MQTEIGGFIPFEKFNGRMLYEEGIKLNCGRNALKYLVRARKIKRMLIPYFLCDSVEKALDDEGVEVEYYHIGWDFKPADIEKLRAINASDNKINISKNGLADAGAKLCHDTDVEADADAISWSDLDTCIYLVNFYGQLSDAYIRAFHDAHPRMILDNVQSYFQAPQDGIDTIYSCRKYFGVSDGAILFTNALLDEELGQDFSYQRMHYILGGFERPEEEFFTEYDRKNNDIFEHEEIKKMSALTENILHGIDYEFIKKRRTENFRFFHEALGSENPLKLSVTEGAFMYPFYTERADEIRSAFSKRHIFFPKFWDETLEKTRPDDTDYLLSKNILPLPVDQRYSPDELERLLPLLNDSLPSC